MRSRMGRIVAVNRADRKGYKKASICRGLLIKDFGLQNDAHGGSDIRQVSLLAMESIEKMRGKGIDVGPGDFAENLTTEGIDLLPLALGTCLRIGETVLLEVTQIGKICHDRCHIYYAVGDCVMPREGIFARVVRGGTVAMGDVIEVVPYY
jgi:MOSC domain-containing protein YiiM